MLLSLFAHTQNTCVDSSSYIQYKALESDSFRILNTVLGKDGGLIRMGYFLNGETRSKPFILKTKKDGEISWCKKIGTPFIVEYSQFETIEEAENGNIFLFLHTSNISTTPFRYLVLAPNGSLIYENKIGFSNIHLTSGLNTVETTLLSKFGQDSMLVVFTYTGTSVTAHWITVCTVSNSGHLGQAFTYYPAAGTAYHFNYTQANISNKTIRLFGTSMFLNNCLNSNGSALPNFSSIEIDWETKKQ